jgi:hypothetical protein
VNKFKYGPGLLGILSVYGFGMKLVLAIVIVMLIATRT